MLGEKDSSMKNKAKILIITSAIVLLAGCASIVSGTSQVVSVNSNIDQAEVRVNGTTVGKTPYSGQIKRGKDTVVEVSKPGYGTQSTTLSTKLEPIFWGNIIFGGLVGSTTDLATGACWEYAPASVYVNLNQKSLSSADFRKDSELKCYAMTYAAVIQSEASAGSGEHLETLRRGFFSQIDANAFAQKIVNISKTSRQNAVSFGEAVAALRI